MAHSSSHTIGRLFRQSTLGPLVALAAVAWAVTASAQGLLVDLRPAHQIRLPRPILVPSPDSYKINALEVNAQLIDQIARVQVSQTFENTGSRTMEVAFVFPLPYDGAIDGLTLLVDGKEYQAELLSAEEARQRYEEIVRKNRDPALLEWVGTGMFQTSVFPIPPGEKRTVTLRYSQLCRTSHGLTDFIFPLSTAKYTSGPLEKLSIRLSIDSQAAIKNVYSPSHAVTIDRPENTRAVVSYEKTDVVPGEDFRLLFDIGDESIGASVISYRPDGEDGYFLLLASPDIKSTNDQQVAKTVVFVVDRSGSMSGEKIEQAKEALKFVLNHMREGDQFNIVAYDDSVETFAPELQRFDDDSRDAAIRFVDNLYAGGSTDINAALSRGLGMLEDSSRPTYVIFLTDGLPTAGETGEAAIVANAEAANRVRARLFPFGVGFDVNSRLLDKLARANFGQSQYVRPNEDIEAAVSALYSRIESPVMTDVVIELVGRDGSLVGTQLNRVYPKGPFDLFAGDQAVIVGRYSKPTDGEVTLVLRGSVAGEQQSFRFPTDLATKSDDDTNAFVAKLWATRRVGEIIDQLDLNGQNDELVKELVELATAHGILTPYTSFLADETSNFRDVTENLRRGRIETEALEETTDSFAFGQRANKAAMQQLNRAASSRPVVDGAAMEGDLSRSGGGAFGSNVTYYDARRDTNVAVQTIRQIGRKTFFQREERWVDSSVSEEEEQAALKVEPFSQEYFDLVQRHGRHVAQYLSLDESIVIKLDGQTYEW